MKRIHASVFAIVTALVIIGMISISSHQVYAPRDCGGCSEFKKLTTEFEKAVIGASDNPDEVSRLVDEYSGNVKALFTSASPSP
jgi:hypothetical protein